MYVTPSGLDNGTGTIDNPLSLGSAQTVLQPGSVLILADGVYVLNGTSLAMGGSACTIQAAPDAKPLITSSDLKPPAVTFNAGTTLEGLWFGGAHDAAADRPVDIFNDVTIRRCTFFNYNQCLNVAGGLRFKVLQSRFVNCGNARLQHSIYVTTVASNPTDGPLIQENLLVGGEGYHITQWHLPAFARILNNFSGNAQWSLSIDGDSHIIQRNVLWRAFGLGSEAFGQFFASVTNVDYSHNVINEVTVKNDPDYPAGADANTFVDGHNQFGTNPAAWALADVVTHLGVSNTALDDACNALQSSFAASIAIIRADATIEANFALLAGALAHV